MLQNGTCAVLYLGLASEPLTTVPTILKASALLRGEEEAFSVFFFEKIKKAEMRLFPQKIPGHDLPVQMRLEGPLVFYTQFRTEIRSRTHSSGGSRPPRCWC